jgi:hypothetical protein
VVGRGILLYFVVVASLALSLFVAGYSDGH